MFFFASRISKATTKNVVANFILPLILQTLRKAFFYLKTQIAVWAEIDPLRKIDDALAKLIIGDPGCRRRLG